MGVSLGTRLDTINNLWRNNGKQRPYEKYMTQNDLININKIGELSRINYFSHYGVLGKRIQENKGKVEANVPESLNISSWH